MQHRFRDKWPGFHLVDKQNIQCVYIPLLGFFPICNVYPAGKHYTKKDRSYDALSPLLIKNRDD